MATRFKKIWSVTQLKCRNLGILCLYYANIWKYNTQKAIDVYWYGKRKNCAQVPFMITSKTRRLLTSLGYSAEEINSMRPQRASEIINACKSHQRNKKDLTSISRVNR